MPQSSIDPIVAENLRALLKKKGRSAYSVATAVDHAPNWLYRVIKEEAGILLPTLREVAGELGVSVGDLVDPPSGNAPANGQGACSTAEVLAKTRAPYDASSDRSPVEILEFASAAGIGAEVYDETPVGLLWFRNDWLRDHSIDPKQANIIGVRGPSMEPTLPDGCSILVDRKRREPHDDRIYVMRIEEGVVVQRLRQDDRGWWQVVSDNQDWDDVPMLYGTEIIGEVRWSAMTY